MAQIAGLPIPDQSQTISDVGPALVPPTGMPLNIEADNKLESRWLNEAAARIGLACGSVARQGEALADKAQRATREFSDELRDRVETVKDEEPVKILAVLTGLAVAAGVAARVWRSNRYE